MQEPTRETILTQLSRIIRSSGFASAASLSHFLRFIIERTLEGHGDNIKEYSIGVEVFDRGEDFDPRLDSIVRVQASKLRARLREYYQTTGRDDPVVIEIPAGAYVPIFHCKPFASEVSIPRNKDWRFHKLIAPGLVLFALIAGLLIWEGTRRKTSPQPELVQLTYDAGLTVDPAISLDGKLLAYASDRGGKGNLDIWIQQVNGSDPLQLTSDPSDEREPVFSPDGSQVAFHSEQGESGIYVVSSLGGARRRIAPLGRRPRFSPDGSHIAYWTGQDVFGKIYVSAASGGSPRQLQPDFYHALYPIWLQDGKHLLFLGVQSPDVLDWDWWVTSIEGGTATRTGAFQVFSRNDLVVDTRAPGDWFSQGDSIIFSAHQSDSVNLWKVSIPPAGWQISATPERLTFGAGQYILPSAASDGRLVFCAFGNLSQIWSLPMNHNLSKPLSEMKQVTRDNALHAWPFVSRNGKKLAYASSQRKSWDIWLRDMETAKTVKLTAPPLNGVSPILDPTGSKVAFAQPFRQPGQKWPLYTLGASGGGPEMICDNCGFPTSWSSDGRKLIYQMSPRGNPSWLDLTSRAKNPFLSHPTNSLWGASFSPDDRWVVFNAVTGEERSRIFVVPFSNGAIADQSVWIPITDGSSEDFNATWSPSGSVMYFSSQRDGYKCLWAQRLDLASKRPEGPSYPVLHLHSARYGILQVHQFRLSASQTGLFFNLGDLTGNIWMTRLPYR